MTNIPQKQNPQTQQKQKDASNQSKKVEPLSQKPTGSMKDEGGCSTSSCSTSKDARK